MSRKDTIKKVLWLSLGSALVFWPMVLRLSDIVFLYDYKNHIRMDRHRVTVISYWAREMLPDTMRMYFCDEDNYAYLFWGDINSPNDSLDFITIAKSESSLKNGSCQMYKPEFNDTLFFSKHPISVHCPHYIVEPMINGTNSDIHFSFISNDSGGFYYGFRQVPYWRLDFKDKATSNLYYMGLSGEYTDCNAILKRRRHSRFKLSPQKGRTAEEAVSYIKSIGM